MLQQVFYYCLKTTHRYKFNRIFAFLSRFDLALEATKHNNDKELFEALLQTISDTTSVNLSLSAVLKNTASHPFDELALECLYNKRANLTPQLISFAAQSKNDDGLLLSIYNNDKFRAYANQDNVFITKLINLIVSKNNVFYIETLKKILDNIEAKNLSLSDENICTLYFYCTDYNLPELKNKILENETLLIQLLKNNQSNKPIFDRLITSKSLFDYIKTNEVKIAFYKYLDANPISLSNEFLPHAHQLILHPFTRESLPSAFAETVVRYTIQASKKTPKDNNLKSFIFDIVEYSYVTNLNIITLKLLMYYCITHKKLDELFCLEKHENFTKAFDEDVYVETFKLALDLDSKRVEVLGKHLFFYNLAFHDNFRFLCYLIKKNKLENIFSHFSQEGFYVFFTKIEYEKLSQATLRCNEIIIPDKKDTLAFIQWAKLLLSHYRLHNQKLEKFINIDEWLHDQKIYSFKSLGKCIQQLLLNKAYLLNLIQQYPANQIQSIIGLHFQLNKDIIEDIERANVKLLGDMESAQNKRLIHKANDLFLKVEKIFQEKFNSYGNTDIDRIITIEKEIKTVLLEQIYLQAKEQKKSKIDVTRQKSIINYITHNKEELIADNPDTMNGLRKILTDIYNLMDITHFQTAWLSYDKGFIKEAFFEGNWDNYRKFFVSPPDIFANGGTYTAGEISIFTNKLASQEVRKRACYYWLLVNDPTDPIMPKTTDTEKLLLADAHKSDTLKFRMGNFFGIISSIYRTNGFGISTCYPGHLTSIMNMGLQHAIGTPISKIEIIDLLIVPVVRQHIKDLMCLHVLWSEDDKAEKVTDLLAFKADDANMLIAKTISEKNKYQLYYECIYRNLNKLRCLVWQDLPPDLIKEENEQKLKAVVENAILGFTGNDYIQTSILEDVLESPCILRDINAENDNIYITTSIKYAYFIELYNCIFNEVLNSASIMPTILQKNQVKTIISKMINGLTTSDCSVGNLEIKDALDELSRLPFNISIDEVKQLIEAKKSPNQSIIPTVTNDPILFAYQANSDGAAKTNNSQIEPKEPIAENTKKNSFS